MPTPIVPAHLFPRRTFAKPFARHACTDEHNNLTVIARALALVSECLVLPDIPASVRVAACDALRAFATAHGATPSHVDLASDPRSGRVAGDEASLGANLAGLGGAEERPVRRAFFTNQKLACLSGCAAHCVRGFADALALGDSSVVVAIAKALLQLSYYDANAIDIANAGLFNALAPALRDPAGFRSELVFVTSELMWNVLEAAPEAKALRGTPSNARRFCEAFSDLVAAVASGGHGDADKELRNELLVCGRLLAEHPKTRVALRAAGLHRTALAIATRPEMSADDEGVLHPMSLGTRARDFEMRRLAWLLVAEFAEDDAGAVEACAPNGFTACLLAFLAPLARFPILAGPERAARIARWSPSQLRDLQELALRVLTRMAPRSGAALWNAGACETAMAAAASDGPADDSIRAAAMAFLERMAREGMAERLGSASAFEAALAALELGGPRGGDAATGSGSGEWGTRTLDDDEFARSTSQKAPLSETHPGDYALYEPPRFARTTLAGDGSSVRASHASGARGGSARPIRSEDPLRLGACALLTALCESDARNFRTLRKAGGVDTLKRCVDDAAETDAAVPIALVAATLNAVWRCIAPDGKNRATFVAGGGMGSLLDLAARCAETLRPATLSVLADILEEPKTHLFFHEWRSAGGGQARRLAPAGAPAITLVLNLWRAEEEKIGFADDETLDLGNAERPLAGSRAFAKPDASDLVGTYATLSKSRASEEAARTGASRSDGVFSRVFAVCSLLGFDNLRRYCSTADALTLAAVERYVDFKEGEVWEDTKLIFERDGMFPTGPDQQTIDAALDAARASGLALEEERRAMMRAESRAAEQAEATFYKQILEQHEGEEAARWYQKDKAKLSMRERLTFKLNRSSMLRDSFKGATLITGGANLVSYRSLGRGDSEREYFVEDEEE